MSVEFLKKKRTIREFTFFIDKLSASSTDILRFLRKTGRLWEEKGMMRWR